MEDEGSAELNPQPR